MAKTEAIEVEGRVDAALPNAMFRVQADNGLILTQSRIRTHIVALWFEPASELFQNSDEPNMCIHSDPTFGDLTPGASVQVKGRLIIFNGTLNDFKNVFLR